MHGDQCFRSKLELFVKSVRVSHIVNHNLKARVFTVQCSIAYINCFRVSKRLICLYINACSFRFNKGQNNEVLCKATC